MVEANAYIAVRKVTFENITINRIHELKQNSTTFRAALVRSIHWEMDNGAKDERVFITDERMKLAPSHKMISGKLH